MNTNLKNIFRSRYLTVLLLFVFGLLSIYLLNGFSYIKNWDTRNDWLHSNAFIDDYNNPEYSYDIKYYDDSGEEAKAIHYEDIEEYRQEDLTLFGEAWTSESDASKKAAERFKADTSYQPGIDYWGRFNFSWISMVPWIVFTLGFALFFIDLKTNFNSLLFSLPFTKKAIFRGKLLYVGVPILASAALGIAIHQTMLFTMIPKLYMNATFTQLLYSGLSHWFLLLLAFSTGSFLGTLLGNLVTGPLLVIIGAFSLGFFNDFLYAITNVVQYFKWQTVDTFINHVFGQYPTIAITILGKSGSTVFVLVLFLALSLFALLLAEKIFEQTSLENNGQVLTVPRYRKHFFLTVALISSVYFAFSLYDFSYSLENYWPFATARYLPLILLVIVCIVASFVLTYYDKLFQLWNKRYSESFSKK